MSQILWINLPTTLQLYKISLTIFFLLSEISELFHSNGNTTNHCLGAMRTRITEFYEMELPLYREAQINESYFLAGKIKGELDYSTISKKLVFVIFNYIGKVYIDVIAYDDRKTI